MMSGERHCHADGAGPCLAADCPIAGRGPLRGHLRPCPGAEGPQHPADFPRFYLDRWLTARPGPELPEFLLARYAEDETIARDWQHNRGKVTIYGGGTGYERIVNPDRVRADIEAKRRIVEMHSGVHECVGWKYSQWDTVYVHPDFQFRHDPTLCLLASVYADHPDYRVEEWKP